MKRLIIIPTVLIVLIGLAIPALAQDPFDGGFSIHYDYGQIIATLGERNDSLQGWIFDWLSAEDSIDQISDGAYPESSPCGEDRDFASGDFNNDYTDELVIAWSRPDSGIFVGIPDYNLVNMIPYSWNVPELPIAAGVLYASDTLAEIHDKIRVAAGNFYADSAQEFVLAYLAADSTVTLTVYDVDAGSLIPEAKGSISDQAIYTGMPDVQKFGTASRFDIATGDLDDDETDEIVLIASDPEQTPETNVMVNIYDYDTTTNTITPVYQNPYESNMKPTEVSCLRRIAATTGDYDADDRAEIAFIDDWARDDQDILHYSNLHLLDFSSDMSTLSDFWDWDSTGWAHLHPVQSIAGFVYALVEYNGDLIAGGTFQWDQGLNTQLNNIARWDGTAWRPLGSGVNSIVYALTVYNGDLIAGGYFSDAGGINVNYIARWDGTNWQPMGSGMGGGGTFYPYVMALTVYNDTLIAGGYFTTAGGVSALRIAGWDGSQWHALAEGMGGGGTITPSVHSLTVYNDELIVGGTFTEAGPIPAKNIARWDGSDWYQLGSGLDGVRTNALTVYNDNLFAGGGFTTAGGNPAYRIARWDGVVWDQPGEGFNTDVHSLTTFNHGSHGEVLVAGGNFTGIADPDDFYRAAWYDAIGDSWKPFDTLKSGPNSYVEAMVEYNGDLILGGMFTQLTRAYQTSEESAVPAGHIGRVRPEGDGVFDTLHARSDFIVDIISEDVDFAPDSADEIMVRGYQDPDPNGPRTAMWVLGVDSEFEHCYRVGSYAAKGIWGINGVYGSRRTMAVGNFVDDTDGYMDLILLVTDTVDANSTIIQAWEIDTTVLIPCGSAGSSDFVFAAAWEDTLQTITELVTANLDTATIELGTPNHYTVDSIIQPIVVLNVPPVHYDIVNGDTMDVSERYPWPPALNYKTYCSYENSQITTTALYNEVRKDWGISAGLKTHFSAAGATVKAHLNTEYGEGFAVQGENSITTKVENVQTAHAEDQLLATFIDYDVWEYPVYRRGERLVGGDVIVIDPTNVEIGWLVARDQESWISDHEVENIFSYPNYLNFEDNPMVATENVIEGYLYTMTGSSQGSFSLTQSEFGETTIEKSSHFGVEVGASLGYEGGLNFFGFKMKWGFEVSVESNYDRSELSSYTNSFTDEDVVNVIYGNINSASDQDNRSYTITPYVYWAKNGALVLDYAASPAIGSMSEPTWWRVHYSDPDPAFILPWRYEPEKRGVEANDNRYRTREIVFIPNYPSPGDSVLIIARVHNFSINPMPKEVQVAFYLGDPDNGGELLYDMNTGDSLFYACDADSVPTIIVSQGEAAAQMVWQVPDESYISSCQRIWAYIDPLDSITPEVHDNGAEIGNNKGWKRLDVNADTKCIDSDGDNYADPAYVCYSLPCLGIDNCPDVANPDQADNNGDGIGDACQWVCGDANGDWGVNVGDAVYLVNYVFRSGECATNPPIGCPPDHMSAGDANGDTNVNIGDVVYLNNFIFNPSQCDVNPPIGCPPTCGL